MATQSDRRILIPVGVRRSLWVASAGRCEFRGCGIPLNRDFLTKSKAYVGEVAHIVGYKPGAARGDLTRSKQLAKDERNLMLMCFNCHSRIDRKGQKNEYTETELLAMKREHEQRIELIYSSTGVKDSLPVLMTFPIGAHTPHIDIRDINHAIIENSKYTRFPTTNPIHIDRADFDLQDNAPDFWRVAAQTMERLYQTRLLPVITGRQSPTHLTIAGFAPIPLLMKLGALVGDKMDASVFDLPLDRWLWDSSCVGPGPGYQYNVPKVLPREVVVELCISGLVRPGENASGLPAVRFEAANPGRGIIRSDEHLKTFRRECNSFLEQLSQGGARVLHIHPATPLSASIEFGRLLLPKTVEEVHVWDWQAPNWVYALRLK